ncbi:MAG: baseplate protein [Rhodobiaceae bacterium]|nr:baseplate protein [Rhodobiaceae bacterium]|tara:strand:- start:31 stop:747 length:717 start_codon:yes stop_codon:yes gene_type:complete
MPLPKISTPTYELTLPSSNRKIKYRPFLVKEEKILIIALESQDQKQIANAIKSILTSCILTKGTKVEKLSTFDIEYLFLNVRGKSVGEQIEVMVTCPDDGTTQVPMSINIDSIKVKKSKSHKTDIKLDEVYTLKMRYPSLDEFIKSNFAMDKMEVDDTFDLIASCIDQVYSDEESWTQEDCTKKELSEFLEQLNSAQFKEIEEFFNTMPKLTHTVKVKNPNTGIENEILLEGLQNFFG